MRTSCAVRGTVGRVKVKLGRPTPPVPGELGVQEMDQRSGWKREPPGAGHRVPPQSTQGRMGHREIEIVLEKKI